MDDERKGDGKIKEEKKGEEVQIEKHEEVRKLVILVVQGGRKGNGTENE